MGEGGLKHAANRGRTAERESPPEKSDVLISLWNNAKWLEQKIQKKGAHLTEKDKQRVYMIHTHAYVCKTILSGLRDIELELRVEELETKLKDGVVIPCQKG